jgi:DNA-binding beta-propeller fold protein YncE
MRSVILLQILILVGAASLFAQSPRRLVVVVNSGDDSVALVDLHHHNISAKIATYKHPQDVVVSPDGHSAFVSAMDEDRVVEVDIPTGRILRRIFTGKAPEGLVWAGPQ